MIVGYKYSRKYVSAKVAIIKTQLNFSLLQYQLYVLDTLFSVVQKNSWKPSEQLLVGFKYSWTKLTSYISIT